MNARQVRIAATVCLALLVHGVPTVWSQETEETRTDRVLLVDEHRPLDWEAISLSLLVREVEAAAAEEELADFAVDVADNTISIVYRDLQFPPDSPEITPDTGDKIQRLSRVLQRFSDRRLLVEGHTAKVPGDPDDGTTLSGLRARAVAGAMADTDLFNRNMISAEGRGEYEPIADNDSAEGRALNRRVEISVFDEVDEGARTPRSVWWKQYTDWKAPGATVFVVDDTVTDEAAVRTALVQEQERSGAPVADLPVFRTGEGIAIIYDVAEFDAQDAPTPDTRTEATGIADALAALDPDVQVRVGGRGEDLPVQRVSERHYQLGLLIAASSGVEPSSTLVGDRPQAFLFDVREYFDPEDERVSPAWSVTGQPDGGDAELTGAQSYTPAFSATVPGEYELTLNVTNELGVLRDSSTVTITVESDAATDGEPCVCELIYSAELSANGSLLLGRYREFSEGGIGGGARFDILVPQFQDRTALAPIRFGLGAEGLYHIPKSSGSIEDPWEFGWMMTAGYVVAVGENFLLMPQIGYGGTVHVLTFTEEVKSTTFADANGRSHYSQTLSTELDLAWKFDSWNIGERAQLGVFLRPGYRFFTRIPRLMIAFDDDFLGHSLTARMGVRLYF